MGYHRIKGRPVPFDSVVAHNKPVTLKPNSSRYVCVHPHFETSLKRHPSTTKKGGEIVCLTHLAFPRISVNESHLKFCIFLV